MTSNRLHFLLPLVTLVVLALAAPPLTADASQDLRMQKRLSREGVYSTTTASDYARDLARRDASLPNSGVFTVPPSLTSRVEFWKNIYSHYTTRQYVLHDSNDLRLIYRVINLDNYRNGTSGYRAEKRFVKKKKREVAAILNRLYRQKGVARTAAERNIASRMAIIPGYGKYRKAARAIRAQLGQADRFRAGLKRSGRYIGVMRQVFRHFNLPEELCALPHVESSFDYNAYSSANAAGIWQFTRGTGRLFMKVNYAIDERKDPITATIGAARLLKKNYKEIGSWPLAITAYNHGLSGMKRAKRKVGVDMNSVIHHYRSRTFGFASKNFYAEFLAALDVARNHKKYFGNIQFDPPVESDTIALTHYIPAKTLAQSLGYSLSTLQTYNPALLRSVIKGYRYVPRGYLLRVPKGEKKRAEQVLAALPGGKKFARQKHNGIHIVRRGDTLSTIARRYHVRLSALRSVNNKYNDRLRIGQRIRIPASLKGRRGRPSRPRLIASAITTNNNGRYHLVRRGDTLYDISRAYGVSVGKLRKFNALSRRSHIYPGQKISLKQP